jgi:hypothetical protein
MVTKIDPTFEIAYSSMLSSNGTLWIAATERGLVRVSVGVDEEFPSNGNPGAEEP